MNLKSSRSWLVLFFVLLLAACGGGGGSVITGGAIAGGGTASNVISGIALNEQGVAIANANITLRCATGLDIPSVASAAGAWSVSLAGQALPCMVMVTNGRIGVAANQDSYFAIAQTAGMVTGNYALAAVTAISVDSGVVGDFVTNDVIPKLSGIGQANANVVVEIRDGNNILVNSITLPTDNLGNWTGLLGGGGLNNTMDALDNTWLRAFWNQGAPWLNAWDVNQVTFASGVMALTLANLPVPTGLVSGSYQTNALNQYGRYEATFQTSPTAGTITGFFTYTGPNETIPTPHNEIDIEIKGDTPTSMQVNYWTQDAWSPVNPTAPHVEHPTNIPLGFDASQGMHTYAFEWLPNSIAWFVDGNLVHTERGSRGALPTYPSKLMLNFWATTGIPSWSSDFNVANAPTRIQVDNASYLPPLAVGNYTLTIKSVNKAAVASSITRRLSIVP